MTCEQLRLEHGTVRFVDIGEGPVVMLLHGLGGTWRNWEANIPALAGRHRLIVPDLPGFGASACYRGAVTVERYTDTIIELLDALGIDSATLVGNSMGGLLTIETAVRHPRRVRSVVLVASGGLPLTSLRHRLITIPQTRAFNLLMRTHLARRVVRTSGHVRRALAREILHDPGAVDPDLLASALAGLGAPGFGEAFSAGLRYDARDRARAVTCPAQILWGRCDRLLPAAMGYELHGLIPRSRLQVWESTGHCPMLEHPARFNALVTAFVADHDARVPTDIDDLRSA